jgi:diguanylate cyclase
MTEIEVEVVEPDALFQRIGDMLARNALDPTPENYRICYRYLSDREPSFVVAVDRLIDRFGVLVPEAIGAVEDVGGTVISADMMRGVANDAAAALTCITGIVGEAGDRTRAYGDALADGAATLAGPVRADETIAALTALTRQMIDYSREAGDQLQRSGEEVDRLRDKLVEARLSADSDPLTGLPNRRALDRRLNHAGRTARIAGTPLTVAICDIDHFKRVNDTHGHGIGDEVIKLVANALGTAGDAFVSRYGGEEFVVLFENVALVEAAKRIDAIRQSVAERDIKIATTGRRLGRISFSAGIAMLRPRGSVSAMLKRADKALYRAKEAGRDRVLTEPDRD